ncbi:MAG: Bax inhibitor-1/YccA family protein [Deltaproteobacteria bacterium]|nr:Bax inhibitor-1/YccA family protein [Deltaproteobacteria bacterium]
MSRVYLWMFVGLGVTGATAFATATHEAILVPVMRSFWILLIAELGLVFALSYLAPRLSAPVAGLLFLVYSALNGLTLSGIFLIYRLGTITDAFAITAGVFGAMSLYATVTQKDLSGWGTFLFIGLLGVLVAGVVNLFMRSDLMGFVISSSCVVVFAGLTAYDTQKLRRHFSAAWAGGGVGSLAIVGALTLYLDFINLFLAILRLLDRRR